MSWTYIFRSLIKPTCFVVVGSAIFKLYGVGLGFGSPNFNLKYSMMILILEPPSNNTFSIVFFLIYIWIIVIWLSITTIVVPTFSIEEPTRFFMVVLLRFWIFSNLSFCQRYLFNLGAILATIPSSKYNLFLAFTYQCLEKSLLFWSVFLVNSLPLEIFVLP